MADVKHVFSIEAYRSADPKAAITALIQDAPHVGPAVGLMIGGRTDGQKRWAFHFRQRAAYKGATNPETGKPFRSEDAFFKVTFAVQIAQYERERPGKDGLAAVRRAIRYMHDEGMALEMGADDDKGKQDKADALSMLKRAMATYLPKVLKNPKWHADAFALLTDFQRQYNAAATVEQDAPQDVQDVQDIAA